MTNRAGLQEWQKIQYGKGDWRWYYSKVKDEVARHCVRCDETWIVVSSPHSQGRQALGVVIVWWSMAPASAQSSMRFMWMALNWHSLNVSSKFCSKKTVHLLFKNMTSCYASRRYPIRDWVELRVHNQTRPCLSLTPARCNNAVFPHHSCAQNSKMQRLPRLGSRVPFFWSCLLPVCPKESYITGKWNNTFRNHS